MSEYWHVSIFAPSDIAANMPAKKLRFKPNIGAPQEGLQNPTPNPTEVAAAAAAAPPSEREAVGGASLSSHCVSGIDVASDGAALSDDRNSSLGVLQAVEKDQHGDDTEACISSSVQRGGVDPTSVDTAVKKSIGSIRKSSVLNKPVGGKIRKKVAPTVVTRRTKRNLSKQVENNPSSIAVTQSPSETVAMEPTSIVQLKTPDATIEIASELLALSEGKGARSDPLAETGSSSSGGGGGGGGGGGADQTDPPSTKHAIEAEKLDKTRSTLAGKDESNGVCESPGTEVPVASEARNLDTSEAAISESVAPLQRTDPESQIVSKDLMEPKQPTSTGRKRGRGRGRGRGRTSSRTRSVEAGGHGDDRSCDSEFEKPKEPVKKQAATRKGKVRTAVTVSHFSVIGMLVDAALVYMYMYSSRVNEARNTQ